MAPPSLEPALQRALAHHRAGQLAEAEALYRQILAQQPNHADVRHLLGALAVSVGRFDQALELIGSAIALRPDVPIYHGNLGETYRRSGRNEEAVVALRRALALAPDYAEAWNNLGCALANLRRSGEAIDSLKRALVLRPDYAEAWGNLAKAHLDRARSAGSDAGDLVAAVVAGRRAVELRPDSVESWYYLWCALADQGEWREALHAARRGRELQPQSAELRNNVGQALLEIAQREAGPNEAFFTEAAACFQQAIAANPKLAEAYANLGALSAEVGDFEAALAAYRDACRVRPEFILARLNYALLLLQLERYAEGWNEHEWRWQDPDFARSLRPCPTPLWDGKEDRDRTILLHAEQGFGDAMQFFRYWPLVAERVGRVVIECHPELCRLFAANVPADVAIVSREVDDAALQTFDAHLAMMSLPLVLGRFGPGESLPTGPTYLRADPLLREQWRTRIGPRCGLRVGLVWAGSPRHCHDYRRSLDPEHFEPLLGLPGIEFYRLQMGAAAIDGLIDFTPALTDFAETAALVAELDLVITVDTAVAHLAGAMGRPVWLLLPFFPDWRWGLERETTPWYASMRLFRQPVRGDWPAVIRRVSEELGRLSAPERD